MWSEFNLAENNPDPGGGILYAIRYDTDDLAEHRATVVDAMRVAGTSIADVDGMLAVDLSGVNEDDRQRVRVLVEELSVTNEAIEYHEAGINPNSIDGLANSLKSSFGDGILSDDTDKKIAAFNLLDLGIPLIVGDLKTAQEQNRPLTQEEYRTVKGLGDFAARSSRFYGSRRVIIIGGATRK